MPVREHPLGKKLTASFEHRALLCEKAVEGLRRARVSRAESELQGDGRSQIWMSSFNPDALGASIDSGESPSSAPFWVPYQDMMTSNHNAQWVQTFVPTIN